MNERFTIGVILAFFVVLVVGVLGAVGVTRLGEVSSPLPAAPATQIADIVPANGSALMQDMMTKPEMPLPKAPAPQPQPPSALIITAPTGQVVSTADIEQLADAVKLGQPAGGDVSKAVWAQETPIAQKMLQGECDCDQRNWLNHFVKTGNYAMTGSEDYFQSVQLLSQLRRGNQTQPVNQTGH